MAPNFTSFDSLPDDIHFELFKYIPFKDKVRYERINCRWQSNVTDSFKKLKSLVLLESDHLRYELNCSNPKHAFNANDFVSIEPAYTVVAQNSDANMMDQVLKRTPNLLAVQVFNLDQFATHLGRHCHKLEHVQFDGCFSIASSGKLHTSCFQLPAKKFDTDKLTCIGSTFRVEIQMLIAQPNVFKLNQLFDQSNLLALDVDKKSFWNHSQIMVPSALHNLRRLRITGNVMDTKILKLANLDALLGLELKLATRRFDGNLLVENIGHLTNLKALSLDLESRPRTERLEYWFERLVQKIGHNLKYLRLSSFAMVTFEKFRQVVIEHCPNLRIVSFSGHSETLFLSKSSKLTRELAIEMDGFSKHLRAVDFIVHNRFRQPNIVNILANCPNVHFVTCLHFSNMWQEDISGITDFATEHPKRRIILNTLSSGLANRLKLHPNVHVGLNGNYHDKFMAETVNQAIKANVYGNALS